MKKYFVFMIISASFITSCKHDKNEKTIDTSTQSEVQIVIPHITVLLSELHHNKRLSIWTLDGNPFSGNATEYDRNKNIKQKFSFYQGRKEGTAYLWHPNGLHRQIANYSNGKLHGEKKVWSSDSSHTLLSHLTYHYGKPDGEQKTWYPTGELHKKLNLNMGKEEGIQKAFRKNGALYANYEAKNGRIFGLKKASLCFGLENEKMSYEK